MQTIGIEAMVRRIKRRDVLLRGGTAMIGLSLSPFAISLAANGDDVALSAADVDETAAVGHTIGTLSVNSSAGTWAYSLLQDANGMFSLSGANLVVGTTTLSHGTVPAPKIVVQAINGATTITQTFTLNVRRPLPSLPLPTGARVAVHGDSQAAFNNGITNAMTTATKLAADNTSQGTLIHARSVDPRFDADVWYDPADPWHRNATTLTHSGPGVQGANQGIFGDHMHWGDTRYGQGMLPRLDYTLSKGAQLILINGPGTNTLNSGDVDGTPAPASYVIAKLDEMLVRCRNKGVPVILATLMPRGGGAGDWATDDPRIQQLHTVNDWIRAQHANGREGVVGLFDPWDVLSLDGLPLASLMDTPRVHPNPRGAYRAAVLSNKSLLAALQAVIAPGSVFDQNPAANNLLGASMGNMTGATGTKTGGGTTGSVATGFNLRMTRGNSTQVASKETISGSLTRQVVTVTPVENGQGYHWSEFSLITGILSSMPSPGQWVRSCLYVEIGDTTNVGMIRMEQSAYDGSVFAPVAHAGIANSVSFAQPTDGNRGYWLMTEPFQFPQGGISLPLNVRLAFSCGGAPFTVKYSRPIVRVVADPRAAWGY